MAVTITNSFPSAYDWIPIDFPDDWDAEDGGQKKYLYTQDGKGATWVVNPSWKAGELSAVIRMVEDWDTKTDQEIHDALSVCHHLEPMEIEDFMGGALMMGLSQDRVREAMNNDGFITRLTNILERGEWKAFSAAIGYPPMDINLTASDINLLLGIPTKKCQASFYYEKINSSKPETITTADIAAAR